MFVKFSGDPKEAKKAVDIAVTRQMREWVDNYGNVCAVVCISATLAPGERLIIVANSGGYTPLVEGMVIQLVYNLSITKSLPWWRRWFYRIVWSTCGQFLLGHSESKEVK